MAENDKTSVDEPVADPTPDTEPESTSDDSTSETAQPTVEELQQQLNDIKAKHDRLQSNYQGTYSEWNREKQERERLQTLINERFQQQPAQAKPDEPKFPSDEELAKQYHQAIIDSNYDAMARVTKLQRDKATYEAESRLTEQLNTATQQTRQQQSLAAYLRKQGLTDPKSAMYQQVNERAQSILQDPDYAFAHGNPATAAIIAINEVTVAEKVNKTTAQDAAQLIASDQAQTEPSTGKGNLPGQKTVDNKIYLTETEKAKGVRAIMRMYHIDEKEAQKKYWDNLAPEVKARRQQEKRAVI